MTPPAVTTPGTIEDNPRAMATYRKRRSHEAPLAVPRKVLLTHAGLSVSSALVLVRLLNELDIRDCDHCADLRYALIAYIRGLNPLRPEPDVLYEVEVNGRMERHLREAVLT